MRLYRVVMRSGVNMDVMAKSLLDDPAVSEALVFYQDETQHHIVATVMRDQVAGLILFPQKSGATSRSRPFRPRLITVLDHQAAEW